ncbi:MAG: hypothetical protein SFW62_05930 [Alphaproteobacteria bacterium]|nr:hypothetical protein [Alphaproteobacteria bacterium]
MNVAVTINHAATHMSRFAARALPHLSKHVICCGLLPLLATRAGMAFLRLERWQEYVFAAIVALAICGLDDAWHRRHHHAHHEDCAVHKPEPGKTAAKYVFWTLFALAATFAVHAAGLHPHNPAGM